MKEHGQYRTREELLKDMKREVLKHYMESDYKESDRLQVSIHYEVDTWVSYISVAELERYAKFWDKSDFETIDKGLLPENFNPYLEPKHLRIMLYCLIEQDLYNDELINSLQDDDTQQNRLRNIRKAKEYLKTL